MQIAPAQKQEVDFLEATLGEFEKSVARESRKGVKELRKRLDGWAAKVAVIGQVKAGKSTFMNALLKQDNLLPSDVNPWTSVVTNLRINIKSDPEFGAKFEFFSEKDWDEIIEGNTKLRNLAEKHLPGFDSNLLKEQVEEMRDQARERLGDSYTALLGTDHTYDFLSPELLQAYVCAGRPIGEATGQLGSGRYSAITKTANVYMRMPEYQVPVIITDTPGVNDPFLVRDEYTCRNLDKSDLFIVVLSAHQALTSVDISLIRLLAAQDSKDVLVFINRIDELDEYTDEVPEIIKDVKTRLSTALPDMDLSIIAGSAFMAEMALSTKNSAQEIRDSLDNTELEAYLLDEYGEVPEDQFDRLMLGSGLNKVKKNLSDAIDRGVGCDALAQIHDATRAEVSGTLFATKQERYLVQGQAEKLARNVGDTIAELEKEIKDSNGLQTKLDDQIDALDTSLEKLMSKFWSKLEKDMNNAVSGFVEGQYESISEKLMRYDVAGSKDKFLRVDVQNLLRELESLVSRSFDKSRAGIDTAMFNCSAACKDAVQTKLASHSFDVPLGNLPCQEFASTLTLSKTTLEIPIVSERSWAFWRGRKVNKKKTLDVLEKIAIADLRPVIEKILRAYGAAQSERAQAGVERIRVVTRAVDVTVAGQNQRLQRFKRQLRNASGSTDGMNEVVNRLQSQLEVLERRLQKLSVISSKLSETPIAAAA
ncbi:dynamin family protein [Aliiroseovarius sp. 2305UL8-7]|uniref:dynamin family protein n=1 Tax=Aliiroseovarius conchicola TaxID=3121637 RepID=UPI0035272CF8